MQNVTRAVAFGAMLSVLAPTFAAKADEMISGQAHIIDGDTLAIGEIKIRLQGIDAPETDQLCLDRSTAKWKCGIAARDHLIEHIAGRSIDCSPDGVDRYRRTLAVCRLGDENLNAWMVREGFAMAFVKYSRSYVDDEADARKAQRGLWSRAFIAPWDWRHRGRDTPILGPGSVPINAQKLLLQPASAADAPSAECTIKGNVNRKGERIYHLPGALDYAKINMAAPGKLWFCSEADAMTAGWRPAKR
jgi:endonuclease YncB( thermonuclease family)